jgi:hypothetical protein
VAYTIADDGAKTTTVDDIGPDTCGGNARRAALSFLLGHGHEPPETS